MPEKIQDEFHVGIDASRTDSNAKPYGHVVAWIPWNSGFRGTGLKIGDVITAIDAKIFDPEKRDFEFNQYSEEEYWAKAGAKDGQKVTLTVVRDGETLKIDGVVRADRYYTTAGGQRAVASPGPEAMAKDGFDETWLFWDEGFVKEMQAAQEVGWQRNTREQLANFLDQAPRIDFLVKTYPGPYAKAMKEDFDATIEYLKGTKYDLTVEDLAYRSLSKTRVQDAIALATKARDEFLAKASAVELGSLPAIDPIRGDRKSVQGKVVKLPALTEISEAGHGWFWAPGAGGSIYLIDEQSKSFIAILRAIMRFRELVNPSVNDTYEAIGRVTGEPTMVVMGNKVYTGIVVEVIAALVDGKVFVDASTGGDDAKFAGEENAKKPPVVNTNPNMGPAEVFRSFVNALKLNDIELWATFFATWSCRSSTAHGEDWIYNPEGGPPTNYLYREFSNARALITDKVYDMHIFKMSKPRVLVSNSDFKVEQVKFVVDHVGLFDGEYRAFRDVNVHRDWEMQRVNGGPWRITSEHGI